MISAISWFFNLILIDPLTNLFVLLTGLTHNAGIAVILLTIIIRLITLPLTIKQMHSTRMMTAIQPRMQEIQKKYKDPKRRSEEQMKLYKEAGINPLGCFSSMILQLPILMCLYRTFSIATGEAPEALIKVSERLYPWSFLRDSLPLPTGFLWLHLGSPDPFVLPLFVAATTYLLQKMTMLPSQDERQQAQNNMMNLMMPLIFGWITLSLPRGLDLYYVLSNIVGMVMQYLYIGRGPINWRGFVGLSQDPVLPRAMDIRIAQLEEARKLGRGADDEDDIDEKKRPAANREPTTDGAGARRRRRYTNGRRRGRR